MNLSKDKILKKIITKAASMQIDTDKDPHFINWSREITGKSYLKDMTPVELIEIFILLALGEYQRGLTTEDDLYLHRAISAYITPKETQKVKDKMAKMIVTQQYKEDPRFMHLIPKTRKVKDKIDVKL